MAIQESPVVPLGALERLAVLGYASHSCVPRASSEMNQTAATIAAKA